MCGVLGMWGVLVTCRFLEVAWVIRVMYIALRFHDLYGRCGECGGGVSFLGSKLVGNEAD